MASNSSNSNQVISLPNGGGALHGIGEKFSPDLHTGTGNFTVPIALPPGRNGFQPQLNLVYSTGNGNGPYGAGWSLSIPGVSRRTSKGIPRYDDPHDVFILSGAEDLVPIEQEDETTRYRPRTEGLFARIEHCRDATNDHWKVWSKDGLVSFYGTPKAAGKDPAAIADPSDRTKVFAWKLTQTLDPFGNRIEYEYKRDTCKEGSHHWDTCEKTPHHWDQLYLEQIRYADYGESGQMKFLVSVKFDYGDRPDPFSEYRAGFEIRTTQRCTAITIETHADQDRLVRTYELHYEKAAQNGASLLTQIEVIGYDDNGQPKKELPPLEFGYTGFEPEKRDFFPLHGSDLPAPSLSDPNMELVDLFGNGLPDILEMNGTVRYWRNLGDGEFDLPRPMSDAPAGLALADPDVQLIDADGDGRTDLLVTRNGLSGYFPLRFGGLWDRRSFQRYKSAPSFNLEDPEVRLVDLDGDGVTDAIRSGTRLECFFNDPKEGWNKTRWVERQQALEVFPNINFSDPRVKWADMSGDGLQDIVLVYDGNVEYWPNLGYGNWGKRIHTENSPRFPYGYDPKRILIGDVDGDGVADLVYVDHCKILLWINQSGNSWSDPIEIDGTPTVSDFDAVRLVDLLGTGISGVLWSADANGLTRDHMFFLDFTGGLKPYLLNEMNNNIGAVTRVEYAPSTRFYLEDQKRYETRWKTPLPFPVQVVERVEVVDAISQGKLTTKCRYRHGYWDGEEREFRGFGMVEQLDTETFEDYNAAGLHGATTAFEKVDDEKHFSPPTLTKTWFHQGPVGDEFGGWEEADYSEEFWPGDPSILSRPVPMTDWLKSLPRRVKRDALRALRGSILRTELYALDGTERQGRPYTVTESLYGLREESPFDDDTFERLRIFFPHLAAQRTTQWERGDDPMTQFTFTDNYDEFGQPRRQTAIACPRGWNGMDHHPVKEYLATRTRTVFAQPTDSNSYIHDRVAKTTTFEIENDGSQTVIALKDTADDSASLELIGQTLNFYDGPAFQGLPFGQVGDYGTLVRAESLVLTPEILYEAYKSGETVLSPPEVPPYLDPTGNPAWMTDHPQEFRDLTPALAGCTYQAGEPGSPYATGHFVATVQRKHDFHDGSGRGLLRVARDPLGRDAHIDYDVYALLPTKVTNPAGLTTSAIYDYRILQPQSVTDPNTNRTRVAFSPLGLVEYVMVMGKEGELVGDTPDNPSKRLVYNFWAFLKLGQPISTRSIQRVHHAHDTAVAVSEGDETIQTVEYSDGFGRLLQIRTQAEEVTFGDPFFGDGTLPIDQTNQTGTNADVIGKPRAIEDLPSVVVSGSQAYNNKGLVVKKYEPFFSKGWEYASPTDAERGQSATVFYDPRGQVILTINPDGSEQRIIYGIPLDLNNSDQVTTTPWEAYTYDTNDNAGRTHPVDFISYQHHWNTPSSIEIDALGRRVQSVERNGHDPSADWYTTRSTYDIRGNLLTVTDALDRLTFRYVYDLANRPLRIESMDAGIRLTVLDASGNALERRDSKGALILRAFDLLNRPIRLWARDVLDESLTLRKRLLYGDSPDSGLTAAQAMVNNLLGKPFKHYDEAGLLTFENYDFKGNIVERVRQVVSDEAILSVFDSLPPNWQVPAFRVDWQPHGGMTLETHASGLLDPTEYRTSFTYDALNRLKALRYPQDMDGARKDLRPYYNRAGALERVELDGAAYVEHIAYNAKGQRTLIAYGNGIMTRHAYDPKSFRLVRLRSERYTMPTPLTYRPEGGVLQDFAYRYDLYGNITATHDRTSGSGIPNTTLGIDALDRAFTYDPLYRLLSATGREHATEPPNPPWIETVKSQDPTLTRAYTQHYAYDPVGNMTQLKHYANGSDFVRKFALAPNANRLATMTMGQDAYDYASDANGNLIREATSRHFEWDHSDRMRVYRTQIDGAEPSVYAQYLYDASGQRVKKLVRKQGGQFEVTVYIDGLFEHHRLVQGSTTKENNTLHVIDNQSRIATVRVGAPFPDDTTPAVKFHLGDHLGSSNVVVDGSGTWINREEYTPYGETSLGSFVRKRYRFTGKERDEESGLYYHGQRYRAAWLTRWISADPAGIEDGLNVFAYAALNPIRIVDTTGLEGEEFHAAPAAGVNKPTPPAPSTSASTAGTAQSGSSGGAIPGMGAASRYVNPNNGKVTVIPEPETLEKHPAFKDVAKKVWSKRTSPNYKSFQEALSGEIKSILRSGEPHALKDLLTINKDNRLVWKAGTPFAGQHLEFAHGVSQEAIKSLKLDPWHAVDLGNLSPVGHQFHREFLHVEEAATDWMKGLSAEAKALLQNTPSVRPPKVKGGAKGAKVGGVILALAAFIIAEKSAHASTNPNPSASDKLLIGLDWILTYTDPAVLGASMAYVPLAYVTERVFEKMPVAPSEHPDPHQFEYDMMSCAFSGDPLTCAGF